MTLSVPPFWSRVPELWTLGGTARMTETKPLIEFDANWKISDLLFSRTLERGESDIACTATFVSGDQKRRLRFSGCAMEEACSLMTSWTVAVYFDPAVPHSELRSGAVKPVPASEVINRARSAIRCKN
jgi:hypothetical protein